MFSYSTTPSPDSAMTFAAIKPATVAATSSGDSTLPNIA
jgi:hypothetical protein